MKRTHSRRFCSPRRLATLANMRAAKERKRQERIAAGWTPETRLERWYPLEIGIRDKRSGECEFVDLRSVRQAIRLVSVMLREWKPDPKLSRRKPNR